MTAPNPELQLAEAFVQETGRHLFLTGKAGTGKTTFLQTLRQACPKRMVVTAPTGVAAINAGGVTLHSFFQLPFGPFIPGTQLIPSQHRLRREKKHIIQCLDLLVIDEISMVRADLLDGVDAVLRRYRQSDQPFGGVQLLMIGDLYQLPPVAKNADWDLLQNHYDAPYFFYSKALGQTQMVTVELRHIYRQTDPAFIGLLNKIRNGRPPEDVLEALNARHIPDFSAEDNRGFITLCTHNRNAESINRQRLEALPGKRRRFRGVMDGEFPEQALPTAASLELKKGAQVMFIRNDMSADKKYYNGKIGRVSGLSEDTITVSCPGDPQGISVAKSTWENVAYQVDPQTAEVTQKVIGTYSQFPLKLAWAITIHKSQGLTFDNAIIDTEAAFAHGQVYVALSRCRSLEGLILRSPLRAAAVKTDAVVRRFTDRTAGASPTAEQLAGDRHLYQQQLLLACFSFDRLRHLLDRLAGLLRSHASLLKGSHTGEIGQVHQQTTAEIVLVGEKFKRQLQGLFNAQRLPAEDPAIRERLVKAVAYFEQKLTANLMPYLDRFAIETDNQKVRRRSREILKELHGEANAKMAGVLACRDGFTPQAYLRAVSAALLAAGQKATKTAPVVYDEADVGHPEFFENLRSWRTRKSAEEGLAPFQVMHQKTLVQIAVHLPDTLDDLIKIRGIGPRLCEKYGAELTAMVGDYRRKYKIDSVSLPKPSAATP